MIWAAGVAASPAGRWLGAPPTAPAASLVEPDLSIRATQRIFVIGDAASVTRADGRRVPGVAPAAKQQGRYVARVIAARIAGRARAAAVRLPRPRQSRHDRPQTRRHRVSVRDATRLASAWWLWGIAHIYFLVGVPSPV